MDQNELPLEPCHLAVPSGAFKNISRPMVRSTLAYLQTDWNELPHEHHHLGVLSGASKINSEPWYFWRKLCTNLAPTLTLSPNGPKQDST
jgi:hypothetical protein